MNTETEEVELTFGEEPAVAEEVAVEAEAEEVSEEVAEEVDIFELEAEEPELEEEADEEPETLEDEPEEKPAKKNGPPKTIPYDRFKKTISERNDLREQVADLTEAVKIQTEFLDTMGARYKRFDNPSAQLKGDADFMDALENLAKTDTDVASFYTKVTKFMETGKTETAVKTETKAAPDARIEAIVEKEARRTAAAVLSAANISKPMQAVIADYVVGMAEDPSALTEQQVVILTKRFAKEKGFKLADLRAAKTEKAETKEKPKTAGKGGGNATTTTTSKKEEPAKKLSREEFLTDRAARLRSYIDELSGRGTE